MATITNADYLNQGVEVTIDTAARTIALNEAGNLSSDGATAQAIYSFLKEEWKNDAALIAFPFPLVAITPEQFEFVSGWEPLDDATRRLIRSGNWREVATDGSAKREYLGVITLGNIDSADTAYYAFGGDASRSLFSYTGAVNEPVQTFGDTNNGDFDYRAEALTVYIREQGKTYDQTAAGEIGLTTLDSQAAVPRFPLQESADLKVSTLDADIETQTPFTNMSISYLSTAATRSIGGTNRDFGVIVDAAGGTAEQVYEWVQYQLRRDANINGATGAVNGYLADSLLAFVGDRLDTLNASNPNGGGTGVFVDNLDPSDTNRIRFADNTETYRTFPFVAAGTIAFNDTLVADPDAIYTMFYADPDLTGGSGDEYGSAGAIVVNDADGNPITGAVAGQQSISFDFDYDGNTQGGRTSGTDADVVVVAIGLAEAQFISTTGKITRTSGQSFSLVSALERNYLT